mmetsp:Transcript_51797/g.130035  ORF Transcript_51797/g.130035 Transcript_51797/m.130035 type:complete len:432 (+) Transcript_51797:430-1725(+)
MHLNVDAKGQEEGECHEEDGEHQHEAHHERVLGRLLEALRLGSRHLLFGAAQHEDHPADQHRCEHQIDDNQSVDECPLQCSVVVQADVAEGRALDVLHRGEGQGHHTAEQRPRPAQRHQQPAIAVQRLQQHHRHPQVHHGEQPEAEQCHRAQRQEEARGGARRSATLVLLVGVHLGAAPGALVPARGCDQKAQRNEEATQDQVEEEDAREAPEGAGDEEHAERQHTGDHRDDRESQQRLLDGVPLTGGVEEEQAGRHARRLERVRETLLVEDQQTGAVHHVGLGRLSGDLIADAAAGGLVREAWHRREQLIGLAVEKRTADQRLARCIRALAAGATHLERGGAQRWVTGAKRIGTGEAANTLTTGTVRVGGRCRRIHHDGTENLLRKAGGDEHQSGDVRRAEAREAGERLTDLGVDHRWVEMEGEEHKNER